MTMLCHRGFHGFTVFAAYFAAVVTLILFNFDLATIAIDAAPTAPPPQGPGSYNMAQTLSDGAQRDTMAFDAWAFLSGSLAADSFFPPGKLADFWGFQYLRDNDLSQMGHNTDFLTRAALNMWGVLTNTQRSALVTLALSQVNLINTLGYKRYQLMLAFRRQLNGTKPAGKSLSLNAVKAFSSELYKLDGNITYARAKIMGPILSGLSSNAVTYLNGLKGKGMKDWPPKDEPIEFRTFSHDVKVSFVGCKERGVVFLWALIADRASNPFLTCLRSRS